MRAAEPKIETLMVFERVIIKFLVTLLNRIEFILSFRELSKK